jgi:hypothetical protein
MVVITPTTGKCIVILAKARTSSGKVYFTPSCFSSCSTAPKKNYFEINLYTLSFFAIPIFICVKSVSKNQGITWES